MNKKCMVVIVFLLLVIVGGVYKFIFQGSVSDSTDGRVAINLDAGETDRPGVDGDEDVSGSCSADSQRR